MTENGANAGGWGSPKERGIPRRGGGKIKKGDSYPSPHYALANATCRSTSEHTVHLPFDGN